MIAGSFDCKTARDVVGDESARRIEAKARADADAGVFQIPPFEGDTYWDQLRSEMARIVYREQYTKRLLRNERRKGQTNEFLE
jgi:hypothetical protein